MLETKVKTRATIATKLESEIWMHRMTIAHGIDECRGGVSQIRIELCMGRSSGTEVHIPCRSDGGKTLAQIDNGRGCHESTRSDRDRCLYFGMEARTCRRHCLSASMDCNFNTRPHIR